MILTGGSACIFNYWAIITMNTKGVLGIGGIWHIRMALTKGGQGASGIMERKGWQFKYICTNIMGGYTGRPLIET